MERIAVIGAGTIGASWAAYFLAHGFDVTVSDPIATQDSVKCAVDAMWPAMQQLGLTPGASPERMRFVLDPVAAVEGAGFVQESGPEREDLKIELFARLDAALPEETIIASSSSGLLMTAIQAKCNYPERTLIGHPFNPPHLMPLVEVVGGERTSLGSIERAVAFYRAIGKYPIHVRTAVRGHIANRLQAAVFREAAYLVEQGVASVTDIDAAMAYGPGLRWALMGPSLTFHLGGGDGGIEHFMAHLAAPMQTWWDDLGTPALTPALRQKIIDGVMDEAGGEPIADIARARDAALVQLLQIPKPLSHPWRTTRAR